MIIYKQFFFADIYTDCQNLFDNDKSAFLELLDQTQTINLDKIVLMSFISHFYASNLLPEEDCRATGGLLNSIGLLGNCQNGKGMFQYPLL